MNINLNKLRQNFEKYERQTAENPIDIRARRKREQQIDDIARKAHGYDKGDVEWEMRFYSGGI